MDKILLTFAVAGIGGFIGIKLKIPAGALVGAMFAVAIFNINTGKGDMPNELKLVAQIVVGALIGLNFKPDIVGELKSLVIPAIILVVGLTTYSLGLGFIISKTTGLDIVTSLFSSSPGGLTDMTLISEAYGAETPKVAMLHLVRLITVISVLPMVIGNFIKLMQK